MQEAPLGFYLCWPTVVLSHRLSVFCLLPGIPKKELFVETTVGFLSGGLRVFSSQVSSRRNGFPMF